MTYQVTRSDNGEWIITGRGIVLHTCDTARDADHYVEACERMDRVEDRHWENPEASYWENF